MAEPIGKESLLLISRYSLPVVSISIVVSWVLYYYKVIEGIDLLFYTVLALMALFYLITLCFKYITNFSSFVVKVWDANTLKRNRIKESINNFDLLSETQQKILWSIYQEKKKKLPMSNMDTLNLYSNYYIVKGQEDIAHNEAVYTLQDKVFEYMNKKNMEGLSNKMANLSNEEKTILNMFCEQEESEDYEHPWIDRETYQAINELDKKLILKHTNKVQLLRELNPDYGEESISLTEYIIDNENFKNIFTIKRKKISLNQNQIAPQMKSGSGSRSSGFKPRPSQ